MTDEERDQMLRDVHDFLFKPAHASRPARAQQLDDLLGAVRTGRVGVRAMLWLIGSAAMVMAAVSQFREFMK